VGLSSKYTQAYGRLPDVLSKVRDGQAPDQFNRQLLKDWGFTSSHDHAFIPLFKELGFLSPDGKPTTRYHDYRDHSRSRAVMAEALREAYGDIFLIKEHPTDADKGAVQGKFKSFHNVSDNVASIMMKNFFALLSLSDLKAPGTKKKKAKTKPEEKPESTEDTDTVTTITNANSDLVAPMRGAGLHYNIQIHLPATKDVEVYNAIFKSLREHLVEE
jgi:hypothetical protein